jgi:hypothetical protein
MNMGKRKKRKLMVGYCPNCGEQLVREAPATHAVCCGQAVELKPLPKITITIEDVEP